VGAYRQPPEQDRPKKLTRAAPEEWTRLGGKCACTPILPPRARVWGRGRTCPLSSTVILNPDSGRRGPASVAMVRVCFRRRAASRVCVCMCVCVCVCVCAVSCRVVSCVCVVAHTCMIHPEGVRETAARQHQHAAGRLSMTVPSGRCQAVARKGGVQSPGRGCAQGPGCR